jgi:hypothetical protein
MASLHSIRIPNVEDRRRAIMLFLDVPSTRLILPGHDMVVTNEHIAALKRAGIPFEFLAPGDGNGAPQTPVQS